MSPFCRPLGGPRSPRALEGLLGALGQPQHLAPRVPTHPRPRPLPAGLGRVGAYLADQAVQVGPGPAHGHHLHPRRVQRLDHAAPDACGESESVRAPLPSRPQLSPAAGPPLPAPVTSARRPASPSSKVVLPGVAIAAVQPQAEAWGTPSPQDAGRVCAAQGGTGRGGGAAKRIAGRRAGTFTQPPLRRDWPKGVGAAEKGQSGSWGGVLQTAGRATHPPGREIGLAGPRQHFFPAKRITILQKKKKGMVINTKKNV